jgi:transcriptional adapter 2-beta
LQCFACGAQIGRHKNTHKYIFMNNGGFNIFPSAGDDDEEAVAAGLGRRRKSLTSIMASYNQQLQQQQGSSSDAAAAAADSLSSWNAREEVRLLDAVEQFGYGNWKDIASHIDTKTAEQAKEEYIKQFIHGLVGKHTWQEELRGYAVDHTQAADRGPLSPTLTGKLPPIAVSGQV